MNKIQLKRMYEDPAPEDGARILVDRLWPRGIKKENASLTDWWKDIAPSSNLRKWFGHQPERFRDFSGKYMSELNQSGAATKYKEEVRKMLKKSAVTLLYSAKDKERNNAVVLKHWLERDTRVHSIAEEHPPKDGLTISSPSGISSETNITYFSLGAGTDISAETYERPVIYIGMGGRGTFVVGNDSKKLSVGEGDVLMIPSGTLCGTETEEGFVYTEIIPKEELHMTKAVKAGEVFKLAELLPYEDDSIVNLDVIKNETVKFVVMAFDEGTGLSPHKAPGDALVFALEGKAVIGYEGQDYPIEAGQTFRFEKNGLHSVTADGRFKMALLLTLK
ncbi:DUF488 family protein, N3 subclade [Blautia liquoris]|nr:DUF488 family protein [Blautia liquoris]